MNYKIYLIVGLIVIGLVGVGINIYGNQKNIITPQYQPNYPMNFSKNESLMLNNSSLSGLFVYTESDYVFKVTSPDKMVNRSTIIINKKYLINMSNTSDNIIIEINRDISPI